MKKNNSKVMRKHETTFKVNFYMMVIVFSLVIYNITCAQKLSSNDKSYILSKLKIMEERDQRYRMRSESLGGDGISQSELDSLEKVLPIEQLVEVVGQKIKDKNQVSPLVNDSLMRLQNILDSINEVEFTEIVAKYGYPSLKRTGSPFTVFFSLHLMGENIFKKWLPILTMELKKGNIGASEFARWYDRNMLILGKKQLYGEYNPVVPCVEDLTKTNIERKKIGLKRLKNNNCDNVDESKPTIIKIRMQ
ncbi:MAG: hypothetical protein IM600_15900 [Bacteroidetes bacterium]|nr:hypothetical protein [Bacteroidota bacterium]MCA6444912.1 hypothetical protein [Bacteroidota bacterium]